MKEVTCISIILGCYINQSCTIISRIFYAETVTRFVLSEKLKRFKIIDVRS